MRFLLVFLLVFGISCTPSASEYEGWTEKEWRYYVMKNIRTVGYTQEPTVGTLYVVEIPWASYKSLGNWSQGYHHTIADSRNEAVRKLVMTFMQSFEVREH